MFCLADWAGGIAGDLAEALGTASYPTVMYDSVGTVCPGGHTRGYGVACNVLGLVDDADWVFVAMGLDSSGAHYVWRHSRWKVITAGLAYTWDSGSCACGLGAGCSPGRKCEPAVRLNYKGTALCIGGTGHSVETRLNGDYWVTWPVGYWLHTVMYVTNDGSVGGYGKSGFAPEGATVDEVVQQLLPPEQRHDAPHCRDVFVGVTLL